MKKQLLLFTACCIFQLANLQATAQVTFQKTFGKNIMDRGYSVRQTIDDGYILTGYTKSFGGKDVYLIKTDANGDTLWSILYKEDNYDDIAYSIQQTTDSGYIMVGSNTFNMDVYLVKTDASGNILWRQTYGFWGASDDRGYSVQETLDSGYIITGQKSFSEIYLIKTDVNGDTLWTKTFGVFGGSIGCSVQQTIDSGYVVAGFTYNFGAGWSDVYLIKTNASGDTLWTKTYGGSMNDVEVINFSYAVSIQQTTDSGYVIVSSTESFGAGANDVYLIKTDSNGDTLWTKTYGGSDDDWGCSVQQTADGGYIIAGITNSFGAGNGDVYLIRTNANGDTLWTKAYGGNEYDAAFSVQETSDNGFILSGYTMSFGDYGIYLIKTDSLGNSSCNQYNTNTITGNTSTITNSTPTIIKSGGEMMLPPQAPVAVNMLPVITDACDTTIGINEQLMPTSIGKQIKVYPNPAQSELYIKGNFELSATFELYDITGRKVLTQTINSNNSINIGALTKGLYVWQLSAEQAGIGEARGKLIVE